MAAPQERPGTAPFRKLPSGAPRGDELADATAHGAQGPAPASVRVLVYSSEAPVRAHVVAALGRRPAADVPDVRVLECATQPAVLTAMDAGGIDLAILDGEARPAGGLGLCRQLKDEIFRCPPVLVLVGRVQDNWLAAWSKAEAAVPHPVDPMVLATTAADLLRARVAGLTRTA